MPRQSGSCPSDRVLAFFHLVLFTKKTDGNHLLVTALLKSMLIPLPRLRNRIDHLRRHEESVADEAAG